MRSISYEYRIRFSTVSHIIKETSKAIWDVLHEEVFPEQYKSEYWKNVSDVYEGQ